MDLGGRVVVITGATGGLGAVAAQAFADQGARLALLSSNQAKLDALAGNLALPREQVLTHSVDLRDPNAVQAAARILQEQFGQAQILIHLVGGWVGGKAIVATDPADLKSMLEQHVWTTWHLLQAFIPQLTTSGWGRVMVVSSPVATQPAATSGAYSVAKAAEEAMILALAQETKAHGVTANILQVRAIDVEHKREKTPSPAHAAWTTPEEIVAAMLYLCSEEAGMANGVRLPLFGGGR